MKIGDKLVCKKKYIGQQDIYIGDFCYVTIILPIRGVNSNCVEILIGNYNSVNSSHRWAFFDYDIKAGHRYIWDYFTDLKTLRKQKIQKLDEKR